MAMGIIIEVLYFRRLVWLGVLGLALVLAESGTGILVLAAFVVAVALRLGLRGVLLAGLMLVFAGVLAGVVSLLVPESGRHRAGQARRVQHARHQRARSVHRAVLGSG